MIDLKELERIANQPSPEEARQQLAELRAQEQEQARQRVQRHWQKIDELEAELKTAVAAFIEKQKQAQQMVQSWLDTVDVILLTRKELDDSFAHLEGIANALTTEKHAVNHQSSTLEELQSAGMRNEHRIELMNLSYRANSTVENQCFSILSKHHYR